MHTLETIHQQISLAIEKLDIPGKPANLYEPVSYTLSLGGKRLRPALVMTACDLFGGSLDEAIHPAVGIELFHNFTLLHDDIMDQAPLRRGKETVYKKWNSNIAILSGDTMFAMANREILKTSLAAVREIGDLFNITAIQVCEGQQYDMDFESRDDVTLPEYLEMIRLKTAVLLACSLKTGALIAGASASDCQLMYDAGISLGMAFQLKDDFLDTYGDEKVFGKTPGGDILEGKKTFLFLKLIEKAVKESKTLIQSYSPASALAAAEKIRFFTSKFDEWGIGEDVEREIDSFYKTALLSIDALSVDAARKTVLLDLIRKLAVRQK